MHQLMTMTIMIIISRRRMDYPIFTIIIIITTIIIIISNSWDGPTSALHHHLQKGQDNLISPKNVVGQSWTFIMMMIIFIPRIWGGPIPDLHHHHPQNSEWDNLPLLLHPPHLHVLGCPRVLFQHPHHLLLLWSTGCPRS